MSRTMSNKVVLEGTAERRLPGLSLYLTCVNESSNKDFLYEFSGDLGAGTSIDPRDYPDVKWDIFASYGRITVPARDRTRKLLFANVSASEAIERIHDEVLRKRKDYTAVHPPVWWTPKQKAEIEQINVMSAKRMKTTMERERLEATYLDDGFIAELKYDGHRSKAHFFGTSNPRVRFDSKRQSDVDGIYTENTDQVAHIAYALHPAAITSLHGTILDGEIMHEKGLSAVGSVMGADPEKAIAWQQQNGWVTYMVFDCLCVKGTWITKEPWTVRRQYLEKIVETWKKALDPAYEQFVRPTSFWEKTADKQQIREWAFANGYEGLILKKKDSPYCMGSRNWSWLKDKKRQRFSCIVMGFENSQSEKYGPRGWIEHIKLGQYDDGHLVEIGHVGTMDEQNREWFSTNRARAIGMVVDVDAQEQTESNALRDPSFVCIRTDVRPGECVVQQEG